MDGFTTPDITKRLACDQTHTDPAADGTDTQDEGIRSIAAHRRPDSIHTRKDHIRTNRAKKSGRVVDVISGRSFKG